MPDLAWNKATWDGAYDWTQRGHEWSNTWGSSQAMFFTTILPRIAASLPAQAVLEIAPGHGRVTATLLPFCQTFHGIDLSAQCTEFCQTRFATHPNATFHTNNGLSLAAVAQHRFNLVFSYDSLVHADLPVFEAYIPQILAILAPGGTAFLHHSNLAAFPEVTEFQHRSTTTSAPLIADLIQRHGGKILVQEMFNGGPNVAYDCFTTFCRAEDHPGIEPQTIFNPALLLREAHLARDSITAYLRILPSSARA